MGYPRVTAGGNLSGFAATPGGKCPAMTTAHTYADYRRRLVMRRLNDLLVDRISI